MLISIPTTFFNKAVGAAAARAAKGAALFRSLLNIHNQFSQVSWLALVWPCVLYVYVYVYSDSDSKTMALSKLTLTTLKPGQNPPLEELQIFPGGGGGGLPPDPPRKCVLCTHLLGGIAFQCTCAVVASPLFTCFLRACLI